MKALILLGGEGTRLRPLTMNSLKSMVPIANKHFYEYQLRLLKKYKVTDVILSVCYLPDRIKHIIGTGKKYGMNIRYVMEDQPLGTGGAVKNAEMMLDGDFFVMNGDILTDINLKKMMDIHRKNSAVATIYLTEVEDPTSYGLVETDHGNRISKFLEKPNWAEVKTKWINAGIYIFNKKMLDYIPSGKNYSLERGAFPDILRNNEKVMAYKTAAYWLDIGTIGKYMQANFDVLEQRSKVLPLISTKILRWNVRVGKKTNIGLGSSFRGPIIIGDFCRIDKGVYSPLTIIGNHCEVGKNSAIERSIIWDNVKIGENVTIKNCIIGNNCEIQSNTILNNSVVGDYTKITHYSKFEVI